LLYYEQINGDGDGDLGKKLHIHRSPVVVGVFLQENSAVAQEDALQPIQFLLQYWLSRSSKVN